METDLSDFHRMAVILIKTSFQRLPTKIWHCRVYSKYDNNIFRVSLFNELSKSNIEALTHEEFVIACIDTLNSHVPSKRKVH